MALVVKQPTANETPDSGQGGSAVTGNSNTGHASTTSSATRSTNGTTTQTKTCRWSAFPTGAGSIVSINLKFTWSADGSVDASTTDVGDAATSTITFIVEHTVNNGSSWTPLVSQSVAASANDGSSDSDTLSAGTSVSQSIPVTTPLDQIQVRDSIAASVSIGGAPGASGNASISASVSGIQLEITTKDAQVVVLM